jgi:hypothetical protein
MLLDVQAVLVILATDDRSAYRNFQSSYPGRGHVIMYREDMIEHMIDVPESVNLQISN